ncbi:hypothetical protein [Nitrosomonas sp.]|uniref:hypothetical protein n=1 Tax=Nitrosomonas sp. TaxID=42353 RepID=UPI002632D7BD|nr:hypothetical protein [Nitrosomonas sp.]MCW5602574.1 hypothetical protein [Nitrosomonas sp.]
MKKLVTQSGIFGPYHKIEVLGDRYRCDGIDFPFVVAGEATIADIQDGDFPLPQRDPTEIQAEIVEATQSRLDTFARSRGYDNIMSACTYANSSVPKFSAEGKYAMQVRDATWNALYQMLLDVQAGNRPIPSGYDEIKNELPVLVWPG